jgi:hypothetical protein
MFPHTPHIESVSLLQLTDDTAKGHVTDGPAQAGATDETKADG